MATAHNGHRMRDFKALRRPITTWSGLSKFVGPRVALSAAGRVEPHPKGSFERIGIGPYVLSIQAGGGSYSEPRMAYLPSLMDYKDVELAIMSKQVDYEMSRDSAVRFLVRLGPKDFVGTGRELHKLVTSIFEGSRMWSPIAAYVSRKDVLKLIRLLFESSYAATHSVLK